MKTAAVLALLLLPSIVHAQAWSGAEKATVDALSWIHWAQWLQNGLLVGLIIAVVAKEITSTKRRQEVLDGYLGAFMMGLAISGIASYFGAVLHVADSMFNPFNWSSSDDDLWRR